MIENTSYIEKLHPTFSEKKKKRYRRSERYKKERNEAKRELEVRRIK